MVWWEERTHARRVRPGGADDQGSAWLVKEFILLKERNASGSGKLI